MSHLHKDLKGCSLSVTCSQVVSETYIEACHSTSIAKEDLPVNKIPFLVELPLLLF